MQISKIQTILFNRGITVHTGAVNCLCVRVHTDEGAIALGETYPAAEAAEAVIGHALAKVVLERGAGAEMRAICAIDVASGIC